MCCTCSTALAGRTGDAGGLTISCPGPSRVQVVLAASITPGCIVSAWRARLARGEPASRARASALARTTSGSCGSAGRSSGRERSRRTFGPPVRMRFMSSPAAVSAARQRAVPAVFGHCPAQAPQTRRTPRRPPHAPSASARRRSPGDRRTPEPPAGRTLGRRGHVRPRRQPSGPDPCWGYRSAAWADTNTASAQSALVLGWYIASCIVSPLTGLPPHYDAMGSGGQRRRPDG
jgi:hypothetical protein